MSSYNINEQEKKRQDFWQEKQTYAFDMQNNSDKPIYSIDTPPPTVSGKLHIGHVFSYTQWELIARYKRMTGHNVFYPAGFDDNWMPTEILAENELKIKLRDTERKDFIDQCLTVTEKYRDLYKNFWISLGMSMDRTRSYSTISPKVQAVAQKRFIELYNKKSINKKQFPALRCTHHQTTIAQAETEEKEFDEFFNDIRFTTEDGSDFIIATTRPELLPACVACFVHPDDIRYAHLVWQIITTALWDKVPLLADDRVKMDKWTWALMCCSYGDEMDLYWIMKYALPTKVIINRYWKIEWSWIEELEWLKVTQAREKIIEIIEAKGALVNRIAIKQSKAISERGKVAVEIIPVHQWFVDILDYKKDLHAQNDKMNWLPEFMKKRSTDWIENLQWDWNISRNRKYGIPIPVRYSKKTDEVIFPHESQLPIDPSTDFPLELPEWHTTDDIIAETMVFDTWFTSGLTPTINQEFLKQDGCDINILPMSLRLQAHDIIRTWLLYTTLHSYYNDGSIPFKDVMISWHVLAWKGEKISKSKSNAQFQPEQLLEQFWADATRYWALSGQLGKDMVFDDAQLKNGRKLVMKLRNAFSFVKMHLEDFDQKHDDINQKFDSLYPTDQRIFEQLNSTIIKMRDLLDNYEFGLAKIAFEEFFRHDFCDNYLEIVKLRLYKPELFENGIEQRKSAQYTLYNIYQWIIKLVAPYLPHITEEIYQDFYKQHEWIDSIHSTNYPTPIDISKKHADSMESIIYIISEVRSYKTTNQLSLWADLASITIYWPNDYISWIKPFADDIRWVAKAATIKFEESNETKVSCA